VVAAVPGGGARAHVGTNDVFHEGDAGPYRLFVTVRPPEVIPGTAQVEVQTQDDLDRVTIVALPLRAAAAAAAAPAAPGAAVRSSHDRTLFTGQLRMPEVGSWQVRVHAHGPAGGGDLSIPVPALALRAKAMGGGLAALWLALLIIIFAGAVTFVGAAVRKTALPPGEAPDARRMRRARRAQVAAAAGLAALVLGGAAWWDAEARLQRRAVYKPLELVPAVTPASPQPAPGALALAVRLKEPGWLPSRRLDDLLPDHGHLMHLFAVRVPDLDVVVHLHPTQQAPGLFTRVLPAVAPGDYQLFADVVHDTGLAETATGRLTIPANTGAPPAGDDSLGSAPSIRSADFQRTVAVSPSGTRIVWVRDEKPLRPRQAARFRFRVEDRDEVPVADLAPYMGMAGHAIFIKHDRSVFAHVHPTGSVPMAALSVAASEAPGAAPSGAGGHAAHQTPPSGASAEHAGHAGADPHGAVLPAEVLFPFAFPSAGDYRIVVQVKRGGVIETAAFDARAADAP
jgi:hypothetical protein